MNESWSTAHIIIKNGDGVIADPTDGRTFAAPQGGDSWMGLITLSENIFKNSQLNKFDTWLHECWDYPIFKLRRHLKNHPTPFSPALLPKNPHSRIPGGIRSLQ